MDSCAPQCPFGEGGSITFCLHLALIFASAGQSTDWTPRSITLYLLIMSSS